MGQFTRKDKPPDTIDGQWEDGIWKSNNPDPENSLKKQFQPITPEQNFNASKGIANIMIKQFGYRLWMEPYLTNEQKAEHIDIRMKIKEKMEKQEARRFSRKYERK